MSHMSPPDENRRRLVTWLGILLLAVSFVLFVAALTRNLIVGSREGRDAIADLLSKAGILAPTTPASPAEQPVSSGDAAPSITPTAIAVLLPTSESSAGETTGLVSTSTVEIKVTGTSPVTASPTMAPTLTPTPIAPTATPTTFPSATVTEAPALPTPTVTGTPMSTATVVKVAETLALKSPTASATGTLMPTVQSIGTATPRPTLRRPTRVRPAAPAWTPTRAPG